MELTRLLTAYATSIAFGTTFLVASVRGVDGLTALWRAVVVAAITMVVSRLLAAPLVDAVLTAIARDESKRAAERPKEDA